MQKANLKGENNIFAIRLKGLMENKVTQQQLADVLNIKRQTVSLYLNGVSLPPIEKLVDIANYFNVSTDYLLGISAAPSSDKYKKAAFNKIGLSNKAFEILEFCNDLGFKEIIDTVNFLLESQYCAMLLELNEDNMMSGINTHYSLNILEKIYKYLSIDTKSKDKLLSISSEGNIVSLSETDINYAKFIKAKDLISVKRIRQSDIVEKVLIDELTETFKSAKNEYLAIYGVNNNAND